MHEIPSWAVAALSSLIAGAAVWGAFRALVNHRLDWLEVRVAKLEEGEERDRRYLHEIDKQMAVMEVASADEITAKIRRLPPGGEEK